MKIPLIIAMLVCLVTSCKVHQKVIEIDKSETINIENLPQEYFDSDYNLFQIANNEFTGQDSIFTTNYLNGNIQSRGKYARNRRGKVTPLKFGEFESYYENGKLRERGEYDIGRYTQCCAGGICSQFYNYKLGKWKYYYSNGIQKANVIYEVKAFQIDTNCEGGDKVLFGKIELNKSKFWSKEGKIVKPSPELMMELETVIFNQGDYHSESLSLQGEKVKLELIVK